MLHIDHLTKHYKGSTKGVTDLTLHIAPGDLYAFIGHNGAGKTTTLKCVSGIQGWDSGSITICGKDLAADPMGCKREMAYIPDNPDLYEYLTGIQYLNFIADVFSIPNGEREALIRQYADPFELTSSLGDLISTYSHGMKQKLAVLSALIHKPRLLLLDEPFVGLDPAAALMLKDIMRGICANGGAIFFSTHVLDVAEKLCNKVAIIREGRLVAAGDMEKLVKPGASLEELFMEVANRAETD